MSTWGTRLGRLQPHQRAHILARDVVCQLGYPGCSFHATEVDHITPLSVLGPDHPMLNDDSNLAGVCHNCHARKTEAERLAAWQEHQQRRRERLRPTAPHPGD